MEINLLSLWVERIQAYQASGQTMKVWCAEQKLIVRQLKYWIYKVQRQDQAAFTTTFRPVTVTRHEAEVTAALEPEKESVTYEPVNRMANARGIYPNCLWKPSRIPLRNTSKSATAAGARCMR